MIHVRILYQKRAQVAAGPGRTNYSFSFLSTKTLLVPYLLLSALVAGEQIATCFSVKKKCLGHNLPPLNRGLA